MEGRGCNDETAALRFCSERDMRVHLYEFFANSWAMDRPMPRLPPVTSMCRGLVAIVEFFFFLKLIVRLWKMAIDCFLSLYCSAICSFVALQR